MAAALLAITSRRQKVVNFVHVFKDDGISIVMRKAERFPQPTKWFHFQIFSPLSLGVWLLIIGSYVTVSFACGKASGY